MSKITRRSSIKEVKKVVKEQLPPVDHSEQMDELKIEVTMLQQTAGVLERGAESLYEKLMSHISNFELARKNLFKTLNSHIEDNKKSYEEFITRTDLLAEGLERAHNKFNSLIAKTSKVGRLFKNSESIEFKPEQAHLKVSEVEANALEILEDGVFVKEKTARDLEFTPGSTVLSEVSTLKNRITHLESIVKELGSQLVQANAAIERVAERTDITAINRVEIEKLKDKVTEDISRLESQTKIKGVFEDSSMAELAGVNFSELYATEDGSVRIIL